MNLRHADGFIRPYGEASRKPPRRKRSAENEPVEIVCVDGSEGADRAMLFALRNTPKDHRLLLLNGAHLPLRYTEELPWGSSGGSSMREGHYWDKDMPYVYLKYTDMCKKEGVRTQTCRLFAYNTFRRSDRH